MTLAPPPRLHVLFAREAAMGLIFRRGPSKRVELIKWDTRSDTFERGHWFHGRIYERRCDLSPNGKLLVYFASKISGRTLKDREYTQAWTAVSRPPWLTALALWPKGDCWHGGGLFVDDEQLVLNHHPEVSTPHPRHRPDRLKVQADPSACGEDDPLFSRRLERDGWSLQQEWKIEQRGWPEFFRTLMPERRVRRHPSLDYRILLERRLDGLKYSERFAVERPDGQVELPDGRLDWIDWDHAGRLILLRRGGVYALMPDSNAPPELLVDLNGDRPEARNSPAEARLWP